MSKTHDQLLEQQADLVDALQTAVSEELGSMELAQNSEALAHAIGGYQQLFYATAQPEAPVDPSALHDELVSIVNEALDSREKSEV